MQKFVYHLVGIEDDLLGYLGLSPKGLKPQDDPDNDEEFDDAEQTSDTFLLEKLVRKLTVLAEINAKKVEPEDDMMLNKEDVGILNRMKQGAG